MYHTFSPSYKPSNLQHHVFVGNTVTPIAQWVVSPNLPPGALPGVPPCLPLKPTPMWRMLCCRQSNSSGGPNGAHRFIVVASSTHIVVAATRIKGHINSNKNIFFSSFNDADPSHIMLVDCCMLSCRECGPIAAVWQRQPPWSIYSITFYPIFTSIFI
jgi:hypothetical protein